MLAAWPRKACDRVPRKLVWWSLRKRGVPERIVNIVKDTYEEATTEVRIGGMHTPKFKVEVGLHLRVEGQP